MKLQRRNLFLCRQFDRISHFLFKSSPSLWKIPYYNDALKASGYKEKVRYEMETTTNHTKAKRKRKIIWFNPPFSMNIKTNIAKNFLQLIDKHFPPEHKLHKIFNRNSVKVSYSCMPNASSIIKSHNKKILESQPESRTLKCNCRDQDTCPLGGECLIYNVVYLAEVTNNKNGERKSYIGLTALTFATGQKQTIRTLYVWSLRDKDIDAEIRWSILDKTPPYKNGSKTCLTEKYHIIFHKEGELLNKKCEILSNCRHKNKFLLCNFKETPPIIKRLLRDH